MNEAGNRPAYLREVLPLLYPEPCRVTTPTSSTVDDSVYREFVVLPDARRVRLLAPIGSARLTAGAIRRYSEPQSLTSRLKREAMVAAVRSGASGLLLRHRARVHAPDGADHIERYLERLLGRRLAPSIHIGPARANRKPVLQLLDTAGGTAAFAKLGVNDLTRRLVRAETAALCLLAGAGFRELLVPGVLAAGTWRGIEVLVTSTLPITEPRVPLAPARLAAAMREVAGVSGIQRLPLGTSPYWSALSARLAPLTGTGDGLTLAATARTLVAGAADTVLGFGSWHGDWTPWNMAVTGTGILLWDWERYGTGVPVGFDPLHFDLQSAIVRAGTDPRAAVARYLVRAPELLATYGVSAGAARTTALLYLVDLAARYLTDRQAESGARLGVLGSWLLPELVAAVGASPGTEEQSR